MLKQLKRLNSLFLDLMTGLIDLLYPDPEKRGKRVDGSVAWTMLFFLVLLVGLFIWTQKVF
ncbi:MAG: hypothetical protein CMK61_01910 [Pseudoalteromonadaceae bacterium]|nr:hypothetical protein [Pseudoalteromonadaceae bacterium]|tara:strand:- start:128 stop:310 length:183 start_codon:yes stop_codon:yes gene_type:complete